jgi:hypothetical protein
MGATVCVVAGMGFIARSYNVTETLWLKNKYPFVLLLQVAVFIAVLASPRVGSAGDQAGVTHES